ncbi:hypothetical protein RR48_08832 [Papilio machaon]|uniref:Uncharacterized protein n=1 Tax=Papilio machaon TaxID=76193 RepID=A0A194R0L5_PAPMA|nr:hypothetical protein RR48_08832 [Papilio machaon]
MAYFFLIATIVLVVGVNADPSNDNQNPFQGFPFDQTPPINLSKLPKIDLPKLPDINIPGIINIKGVQLPSIDFSQLPDIPESEMPVMPPMPLFFPQIHITSFNNDNLKRIKPGPNQHFVGSSSSSFTVSSNVNGRKNYAGATKTIVNNNGHVDEQALIIENSV